MICAPPLSPLWHHTAIASLTTITYAARPTPSLRAQVMVADEVMVAQRHEGEKEV